MPEPWYRQPLPLVAATLAAVTVVFGIVLLIVLSGDDSAPEEIVAGDVTSSTIEETSTTVETTTTTALESTTTVETTVPVESSTTTEATTTTTAATTTTTAAPTTTVATTTTVAEEPPTITVPPGQRTTFTVLDVLMGSPDVSEFAQAIADTGLDTLLDEGEDLTVLVPSNRAFEAMNPLDLAQLRADPDAYETFVRTHIIEMQLTAAELFELDEVRCLADTLLQIDPNEGTIGGARLVVIDVETANGIIHVLDVVLS